MEFGGQNADGVYGGILLSSDSPSVLGDISKTVSKGVSDAGNTTSGGWNDFTDSFSHPGSGKFKLFGTEVDPITGALGGPNSFLNQTLPSSWIEHGTMSLWNGMTSKPDAPQTPGAAPTLQNANWTALQGELQQEKNTRSTWNNLTGAGGLLSSGGNQSSLTLMGN